MDGLVRPNMINMKSIYILLMQSDTYVSKVIGLATRDRYTHASISFDENLQPLYSFARKYVNFPLPAGMRTEPLDGAIFLRNPHMPCALYELKVSEEVYDCAKREVERMMEEADQYRYNVLGLLLCKFNIPLHRDKYYFCSEFVAEVLKKSNAVDLPKDSCFMRPVDYSNIPEITLKYEGDLCNLVKNTKYSVLFRAGMNQEKFS